ncbi:MAG: hypothetical protein ACAH12_03270 [Methylophilaceae bacterium]
MGIFDIFKSKKTDTEKVKITPSYSMPTVEAPKELFTSYKTIFYQELDSIPEFSKKEKDEMYRIISADEGHINLHRYFKVVFEKLFYGKKWTWTEYEKWNLVFKELNHYPVRWINFSNDYQGEINVEIILDDLKVSELKEVLNFLYINIPSKSKKDDLKNLILQVPNVKERIQELEIIKNIRGEKIKKIGYEKFKSLMLHINFRAKCLSDRIRAEKIGIKKSELMITFKEDKKLIDIAIKENPQALTPLFPMDSSIWQSKIEF